jgi:tetratricopeptide (TPR) repeat protein
MRVRTANSLFIDFSFKRYAGFYQHLLNNVANFQALGEGLVEIAEHAKAFRRFETVEEVAQVLTHLPLEEYEAIGQYYLGWREFMRGGDARAMLERSAEYGPGKYRALAMSSLAATEERENDYASAIQWVLESMKLLPSTESLRGIAVIKAKAGDHKGSLKDLENILPLARHSEPLVYFDCLNSLAVELGEVGRMEEARNICKVVLASPYACAYPEWQETAEDLRGASRSFVAINSSVTINSSPHTEPNLLFMPAPERQTGGDPAEIKQEHMPARVFNLQQWKKKIVKEPDGDEKDGQDGEVSDRQMLLKIVELASMDDLSDEALREMVEALENIVDTYTGKEN